jgi:hypothetical protein
VIFNCFAVLVAVPVLYGSGLFYRELFAYLRRKARQARRGGQAMRMIEAVWVPDRQFVAALGVAASPDVGNSVSLANDRYFAARQAAEDIIRHCAADPQLSESWKIADATHAILAAFHGFEVWRQIRPVNAEPSLN